jgi:Carboxypeptidase regulatory-like domain
LENQYGFVSGPEKACDCLSSEEATMRIRAIVLAFIAAYGITAQTGSGYAFRVHVVNSITGAPIAGANVVIEAANDATIWGRTDAGGLFAGHSPSVGKQLLVVTRKGYRITGTGPMGTLMNVEPTGENSTTVRMLPLGVIAGRVLDQYGDPVRHALVHELQKWDPSGEGEFYEGSSSGTTDDRGEYRIADVAPGRYYVAAECSLNNPLSVARRSRVQWPEIGGLVLFPDVTDIGSAQQVEVSAGATTRLNDLHLKMQRAISITGHVKPGLGAVSLDIHRAGVVLALNASGGQGGRSEGDGSFTFHVLPGTYVLSASDQKTGKVSKEVTIQALDKDVANVEVTLDSSYEISGRIIIDGRAVLDFSKINLNFLGGPVKIGSDGSFHEYATGSKALYMLYGLPEDWYIKDVTAAGQHLTGRQFELKPGITEASFTLSPHGARVEVTRSSTGSVLESAVAVMLLPEDGPAPDPESMVHAEPDQSGKLVAHGVPPGSYRVFALDATNFVFLFNPKMLMEKYGKSAPLVTVGEGEHKSIVV